MIYQREEQAYKMMILKYSESVMKWKRKSVKYPTVLHHQEKEAKAIELSLKHQ